MCVGAECPIYMRMCPSQLVPPVAADLSSSHHPRSSEPLLLPFTLRGEPLAQELRITVDKEIQIQSTSHGKNPHFAMLKDALDVNKPLKYFSREEWLSC